MMNSILLSEGVTDYVLLQIYMCESNGWVDDKTLQSSALKNPGQKSRILKKDNNQLTIMTTGGCSRIPEALDLILLRIKNAAPPFNEAYKKIAIVTDNDETGTKADTINMIKTKMLEYNVVINETIQDRKWISCKVRNAVNIDYEFKILLLIIPFTHQGAMETFLLDAISANDPYDASIINECRRFVSTADPDSRYLKKRRDKIKAEFTSYFCIRTPAEAYQERNSLMKTGIRWSDYNQIQQDFSLLADL